MRRASGIVLVLETESSFGASSGYVWVADLASGGMGRVDLCLRRHGAFQRLYAVKRLHPHYREDEDMRTMFLDEARVAGLLRHANIVSVLDVGEDDDGPFLVMDYVEGTALSEFIQDHARAGELIPAALCASIVSQIARGLHAAHEQVGADGKPLALVHRDVSPQNVLVGRDGLVRVTDFGISKAIGRASHTSTGLLKGKVGYMSPEQLRFERVDRRSDLFALGIVFYELVTGCRLYKSPDSNAVARRILTEPAPDVGAQRPDIPAAAVELCFRLLAKDPQHRPADASEVSDTLDEAFALDDPIDLGAYVEARFGARLAARRAQVQASLTRVERESTTTGVDGSDVSPRARHRWPLMLASAVVVAGGGVALWTAVASRGPDTAQDPPTAAPAPHEVELRVESRPAGAEVRIGSRVLGTTPLLTALPADAGTTVDIVLEGFAPQRHVLTGEADERVVVALEPLGPDLEPESPPRPEQEEASEAEAPQTEGLRAPSRRRPNRGRTRAPKSARDSPEPQSDPPRFRRFD